MTYEYRCNNCVHLFDVIKPARDMELPECCPRCANPADRVFVPRKLHLSKTKVQHAEYNPGLGTVVKNREHASEIAKSKGLVEVGNDYRSGDKMQTEFDTARESKLRNRYEDI